MFGWGRPRRETTIAIQFAAAALRGGGGAAPNVLLIHVQPDEGLSLAIGAKMPGQGMSVGRCTWTSSAAAPSDSLPGRAYER
jgi:glucose-6-phosphate 1-dehydrogenase